MSTRREFVTSVLERRLADAQLLDQLRGAWAACSAKDKGFPEVPAGAASAAQDMLELHHAMLVALLNTAHSNEWVNHQPTATPVLLKIEETLWNTLPLAVGRAADELASTTLPLHDGEGFDYHEFGRENQLWWIAAFASFLDDQALPELGVAPVDGRMVPVPETGKPIEAPPDGGSQHQARVDFYTQVAAVSVEYSQEGREPIDLIVKDQDKLGRLREELAEDLGWWANEAPELEKRRQAMLLRDLPAREDLHDDLRSFSKCLRYFSLTGESPPGRGDAATRHLFNLIQRIKERLPDS